MAQLPATVQLKLNLCACGFASVESIEPTYSSDNKQENMSESNNVIGNGVSYNTYPPTEPVSPTQLAECGIASPDTENAPVSPSVLHLPEPYSPTPASWAALSEQNLLGAWMDATPPRPQGIDEVDVNWPPSTSHQGDGFGRGQYGKHLDASSATGGFQPTKQNIWKVALRKEMLLKQYFSRKCDEFKMQIYFQEPK